MKSFCFLLLMLNLNQIILTQIISIPFKFKNKIRKYLSYKTKTFFEEYFKDELILELNIGKPFSKIDAILNQNSSSFIFTKKELHKEHLINNYYSPNDSSTYNLLKKHPKIFSKYLKYAQDLFHFNNTNEDILFNFLIENKNTLDKGKDLLKYDYLPEIGINSGEENDYNYPNFFSELKNKKIINENCFTIIFNNSVNKTDEEGGNIIFGNDLSVNNLIDYKNYLIYKLNFTDKFSFEINSIYAFNNSESKIIYDNSKNKYNIEKRRGALIDINSGFIIGSEDFMNYIETIYFGELIERNICNKDLVKIENDDNSEENYTEYYIYNCYDMMIEGRIEKISNVNYYEKFPKIVFNSELLGVNFEFKKEDLFKEIFSRYYFLIIFKNNNSTKTKEKNIWYLGQPFLKKYPISINYDSKTISFFFKKETKEIIKQIKTMMNNLGARHIIKYVVIILIFFGILFGIFYLGLKIKYSKKKGPIELKENDYEYISVKNKDINGMDSTNNKGPKVVELNPVLGI